MRGFALLATLALIGCGQSEPLQRPLRPTQVLNFDQLFSQNCVGCHGTDGTKGAAPPLNDALFLKITSDDTIHDVIARGRPGTLMPAFVIEQGGALTTEQVDVLAKGLRGWGAFDAALSSELTQGKPGKTDAGLRAFGRACAVCHGENGKTTELPGPINDPSFLALASDQVLRRIIITGRADLGMPNYKEKTGRSDSFKPLTAQEIADLVALLASWRKAELPSVPPPAPGTAAE
jgi:mono/diheme cytochrome c family protein